MLSIDQKKAVFVATKSVYTVSSKTITCSKIFTNQVMSAFPAIVLYFGDEENQYQNSVGNSLGSDVTGQRSLAMLSINIYAKDEQGLSGHDIARDVARQLSTDIRTNWKSLSSDTVKFRRKSATRNLTNLVPDSEKIVFGRYQMDIFLAYDLTW